MFKKLWKSPDETYKTKNTAFWGGFWFSILVLGILPRYFRKIRSI